MFLFLQNNTLLIFFLICEIWSLYGNSFENLAEKYSSEKLLDSSQSLPDYYAFIELKQKHGEWICSGALIAPSVVLTTARCLFDSSSNTLFHPAELHVILRGTNIPYGVTHIRYPDTFDMKTLRDNIAMLFLEDDISTIKPVKLSLQLTTKTKQNSSECLQTQTSYIQSFGKLFSGVLSCAQDQTSKVISDHKFELLDSSLIVDDKLIGIASYENCCSPKECSTVFTDVSYHSKWIQSLIGTGCNQNSSIWGWSGFGLLTLWTLKISLQRNNHLS